LLHSSPLLKSALDKEDRRKAPAIPLGLVKRSETVISRFALMKSRLHTDGRNQAHHPAKKIDPKIYGAGEKSNISNMPPENQPHTK
jgi:hypothetical protein